MVELEQPRTKEKVESETYARGLKLLSQNQLLPKSGNVMVRTSPTLAKLMHVQNVNNAACPRLGTIAPSNLHKLTINRN